MVKPDQTRIPVLFTQKESVYLTIPKADCWDIERDARRWGGGSAIVAHPPCRAWGKLRTFAKPPPGEKELGIWAIRKAQLWGGVVEHPEGSHLWKELGLPFGKDQDKFGGWTLKIDQHPFGHKARKRTWLYIVGVKPQEIPNYPLSWECVQHFVAWTKAKPGLSKPERSATPRLFAEFLIEIAQMANNRR